MPAKKILSKFKEKINPELELFFKTVIEENNKIDTNISEAIDYVRKITMSGGKRARAAFMYYGYIAAGGTNTKEIIKASVSIELIHSFLLIHDDIIDQDDLRHGIVTTHTHYCHIAQKQFKAKDAVHFGNSMAIVIGDLLSSMGNRALLNTNFPATNLLQALQSLQNIIFMTIVGETEDILIENRAKATEHEVMQMYINKTAKYTIEGPLHLGAILAGADKKLLQSLSDYAIPVGIAFQIQDDILGVFGDTSKTGKNSFSDIVQGKQTLLVIKALEKANKEQKIILKNCLGNINLSELDLDNFKKIIIDTGALQYNQELAQKFINESKIKLDKTTIAPEAKEFLLSISDYILDRKI